ncbi:TIGR01777 family oxidoreductase [Flavobacteriaceae bacterium]|nr:TIGR01777 family oxidoreductase [Flavobacteriaceae bacterium]MDC1542869.1 TIGR01777 family oxidoreductase [Flavobacteriaceae bacterium]
MKLLITGATGLVGKELVQRTLSQGVGVHFLTTRQSKINSIEGAKGFYWNPSLQEIDMDCFKGVDTIIHLAGATISKRWTSAYKKTIKQSRVETTQLLLKGVQDLSGDNTVTQLVSASAIGIYSSDFDVTVDEETQVSPQSFMEEVVIEWEKQCNKFSSLGVKVSKLRIGLVLSEDGGVVGTLKIPTLFGLGAAFGNGKQGQSWIHIDDLVSMFLYVIEQKLEGVFNAVSPNPVSQSRFISALAKAINRPHVFPPLPKFLIDLLMGEMSSLVLDSHWVSSKKILKKGFTFKYETINGALDNIFSK